MIKKTPPTNLIALLDIKNADNLVKNYNIWEIYLTFSLVENTKWVRDFMANYKDLKPSDFEYRQIEIFQISNQITDIINQSNKHKPAMMYLKDLGTIGIMPAKDNSRQGLAITYFLHIVHFINEIRRFSAYLKVNQVRPDFSNILINALRDNLKNALSVAGSDIHWNIVHRYYGLNNQHGLPSEFEPHLQVEDISWRKTEHILFEIDPKLGWWRDLDYVAVYHDGAPVVFNMIDMAINLLNNISYSNRTYSHFRESLHNELYTRYISEKPLELQVLGQIDGNLTKHFQKKPKAKSKKVLNK
ncbi:MAG: hypothetical protein MUF85_03335, partial [Patescibacteria group bacterium]|nr:hypothetical protein [Patescibacteria group bacterium]